MINSDVPSSKFYCVVINLDDRQDRWHQSQIQFEKLPSTPKRISAVDAKLSSSLGTGYLIDYVAACNYSHRLAWQGLLSSEYSHLLVLEDDFLLKRRIDPSIFALLEVQNLDLLQLGYITSSLEERTWLEIENFKDLLLKFIVLIDKKFVLNLSLVRNKLLLRERVGLSYGTVLNSFGAGTHAYIINRHMAQELLKMNDPIFLSADAFLIALARMRIFRMGRLRRSIVAQSGSTSSMRFRN